MKYLLVIIVLTVFSCSKFDPKYQGTKLDCSGDKSCPKGFHCVNDKCIVGDDSEQKTSTTAKTDTTKSATTTIVFECSNSQQCLSPEVCNPQHICVNPDDFVPGDENGKCYGNHTCNESYICNSEDLCVKSSDVCDDGSAFNECGGCSILENSVGKSCGGKCETAVYVCSDDKNKVQCFDPLENSSNPGDFCGGVCNTAKYECDSDNASVICIDPLKAVTPIGTLCGVCGTGLFACNEFNTDTECVDPGQPCGKISDTGQNKCYGYNSSNWNTITCVGDGGACSNTDGCGQDAQYTIHAPNFLVIQNKNQNVVVDLVTGLIWKQAISSTLTKTFDDSKTYCDNLIFASFHDWRLPNDHELLSILYFGEKAPFIHEQYFPNTLSSRYWSQTQYANNNASNMSWAVDFSKGTADIFQQSDKLPVRCIRGGDNWKYGPMILNSDFATQPTVKDEGSGLEWQNNPSSQTWSGVLKYCESLSYAGHDDWRLPTIKELRSIIKSDTSSPALDIAFKYISTNDFYWSATTNPLTPSQAYIVGIAKGEITVSTKDNIQKVRCVRGP